MYGILHNKVRRKEKKHEEKRNVKKLKQTSKSPVWNDLNSSLIVILTVAHSVMCCLEGYLWGLRYNYRGWRRE